jgi:hypothetical protein
MSRQDTKKEKILVQTRNVSFLIVIHTHPHEVKNGGEQDGIFAKQRGAPCTKFEKHCSFINS